MFPLILIIIIVICLIGMGAVVFKNLPKIRAVDSHEAPVVKQTKIKRKLLEERFTRRLNKTFSQLGQTLKPLGGLMRDKSKELYRLIIELEEKYRHRALKANFRDKVDKQEFIGRMLSEAETLLEMEDLNAAEAKYIEILKLDEMNIEAYKGLGETYLLKKDYEHAKETFEFLLKITENDPFVYRSLGAISSQKGDLKRAQDEFKKSLELDKTSISTYLELAEVYLNLDEPRQAFEIVQQAAGLEPHNPRILDFLIEISIIVRDKDTALKAYNQLKEVNPENQKLLEMKEKIDEL
jgi:tetratricopeptide (TPR) repeat protein